MAEVPARAHGWAAPVAVDYERYTKSSNDVKDIKDEPAPEVPVAHDSEEAVGGVAEGQWIAQGKIYEWDQDFGDVGPRFEALERMLFGAVNHVKQGENFNELSTIQVYQEGTTAIQPILQFEHAGLHPVMMDNIRLSGYKTPTPIQQYLIPAIGQGYDVIACAQTGSGKTSAFLIPIISRLMGKAKKLCAPRPSPTDVKSGRYTPVQAQPLVLIICPSRELATQTFDECRRACYRSMLRPSVVYGGVDTRLVLEILGQGVDILVGTPGRLTDMMNRPGVLSFRRLRHVIIDEADEMLSDGFEADLKTLLQGGDQPDGEVQYVMASATFPKALRDLAVQHMKTDHCRIRVGRAGSSPKAISHDIIYVENDKKRTALVDLLLSYPPSRTIIFVATKRAADEYDDFLYNQHKLPCTTIHSGRTMAEREDSLRSFRKGACPILISTDVLARGLDVANVLHVINVDMPSAQYGGIQTFVHRVGRCARVGNNGLATSFFNDGNDDIAEPLVKLLLENGQKIPDFLLSKVPPGFVANTETGIVTGDLEKLRFEDDWVEYPDDDDAGNGENGASGDQAGGSGDAWGASAGGADAWS